MASYGFVQTLKPEDYVAIVAYDLRPEILCDFTTDRGKVQDAMQRLRIPGFSESNMFDAVVDTEQRMSNIEGRKAILLIASGRDTFSKLTFDKATESHARGRRANLRHQPAAGYAHHGRANTWGRCQQHGFSASRQRDEHLRARDRRPGVLPALLRRVSRPSSRASPQALRNQYSLTYHPSNQAKDGKFRKIKVELVDPQTGEALRDHGRQAQADQVLRWSPKAGYTAPRAVE